MKKFDPSKLASGRKSTRSGMKEFGIPFSEEDAQQIRAFALNNQISFSEAVRTLVEWGLESGAA